MEGNVFFLKSWLCDHLLTLCHSDPLAPTQFREPPAATERIIYLCLFPDTGLFWVTLKICMCSKGSELMVFLSSSALRRCLPAQGPLLKKWPSAGLYG